MNPALEYLGDLQKLHRSIALDCRSTSTTVDDADTQVQLRNGFFFFLVLIKLDANRD